MIVLKLMGGLGNQLFQYAYGRSLATQLNTELVLDLDFLLDRTARENFVFRNFDLDLFDLKPYSLFDENRKRKFYKKSIFSSSPIVIKENGFQFSPITTKLKKGKVYLDGYWQSHKYFEKIAFDLRKELKFRIPLTERQNILLEKIKQSTSVCVNFRRADFVTIQSSIATHGIPPMSYYYNALKIIKKRLGHEITVYVFSDDIEWCQSNFETEETIHFVTHAEYKGDRFSAYLQLMKQCKHFIIPNSTFGWWAAWLSDYKDKIVITPKQWFLDPVLASQTQDLRPDSWLII